MKTFKIAVLTVVVANILLFVAVLPKRGSRKANPPAVPALVTNREPAPAGAEPAIAAAMNSYRETWKNLAARHADKLKSFEAADVLNMKEVGARDELEERMTLVREFGGVTRGYLDALEKPDAVFERALTENGITGDARSRELDRFQPGIANRDKLIELRTVELEIAEAMQGVLSILHTNWGQWTYSAKTARVAFDRASGLRDYDTAMERIRAMERTREAR